MSVPRLPSKWNARAGGKLRVSTAVFTDGIIDMKPSGNLKTDTIFRKLEIALPMSGLPNNNALKTIALKRKRILVWPRASRLAQEDALQKLIARGNVRELTPPDSCCIHPSTEARGLGFQHERRVWSPNDLD